MENANGKSFVTNQYALVTYGKSEKEWPFIACSNAKFTEVRRYPSKTYSRLCNLGADHCSI